MYFAVEPTHPDLPQQIGRALAEVRGVKGDRPLYVYALADGVFDETLLNKRPFSRLSKHSLYDGMSLQEFGHAAPHLLALPDEPSELDDCLKNTSGACSGKPMLSFMASCLSADSLRSHLSPYLVARTEDGTEWPIRWADTRVLPGLLDALDAKQRAHLLSPLYTWWSIDRQGTLGAWTGTADPSPAPADFDALPLSDGVFAHLVDLGEADAILANIHDVQPDVVQQHRPSECHARVVKHFLIADQHGISAAGAVQHFCTLGLLLAEDFTRHPAMATLLQRTLKGSDYASEIKALPACFWLEAG